MKNNCRLFFLLILVSVLFVSCSKGRDTNKNATLSLNISAPEEGFIYLDGSYTGYKAPHELPVEKGKHVISVALESSYKYLRKEIDVTEDADVQFAYTDQPEPKIWKALWIGVQEVTGSSSTGLCSTHFSKDELNAGFDFFQWSIKNHFEKYSYGTMKWEIERKDITTPIELHKSSDTWFTVEPSSVTAILPEIKPGAYDAVFVFWRESDGSCSFKSSYFGLAWTDPMNDPIKTGYITVKFDAGSDINEKIAYYKNNDPGVWVHEWLHTVGEHYFQDKGRSMPDKGQDGLVVHAAEKYGYTFPWMNWYEDFMSGKVKDLGGGSVYLGIGPEALLKCSLHETAAGNCDN